MTTEDLIVGAIYRGKLGGETTFYWYYRGNGNRSLKRRTLKDLKDDIEMSSSLYPLNGLDNWTNVQLVEHPSGKIPKEELKLNHWYKGVLDSYVIESPEWHFKWLGNRFSNGVLNMPAIVHEYNNYEDFLELTYFGLEEEVPKRPIVKPIPKKEIRYLNKVMNNNV